MKQIYVSLLTALLGTSGAFSQTYAPNYQLIDPERTYYNEDLAVSAFNVLDYGVDNTGETDCTSIVQKLIDAAAGVGGESNERGNYANKAGGNVYFPAGTYLFTGKLVIPRGVSIRGDWKAPNGVNPIEGTVFAIKPKDGVGDIKLSQAFITMQSTSQVSNLTFWYPEQDPNDIKPHPATILYGQNGYWGNEYCNVRHCTFVNSYIGVQLNYQNGGGCPNIFDIYGTPLSEGFEIDAIADVGRFDGIHFSPVYWETSGLPGSPSAGEIDSYLYENATAVVMRRNDWSYTCNMEVEGYRCGFSAETGKDGSTPNGHNYNFTLKDCKVGVEIHNASGCGLMLTRIKTPGCATGVLLHSGGGPVQFYECEVSGKSAAIQMDATAGSSLMFQDCKISGKTSAMGGHLQAVNNTFDSEVFVGPMARTIFVDNKLTNGAKFNNQSIFQCAVGETGKQYPKMPGYKDEWMEIKCHYPSATNLFVVTDEKYGAEPLSILVDLGGAKDNTDAIQNALNDAKTAGGGIVYLPSGHYRCNGTLTIPSGVELKGSSDLATVPKGNGAVLEVYSGEGDAEGTPFITMEKGSGLRGVSVNYPTQTTPKNVKAFPYTVRGNADCYIVNLAMRAAYKGVDLFTNKCDNHYVDFLSGHAFKNVIKVGGNSENGIINNIQFNTIAYACGAETKFGAWPNTDANNNSACYGQNTEDLEFFIIGDCKNQVLYNNFLYGCNKGMYFVSDGQGGAIDCRSLGNAVDGAVNTFVIESSATDIDFINSQIVALTHRDNAINQPYLPAYFIYTGENFNKKATFFSTDNWGGGEYMICAKGGDVVVSNGNFSASGSSYTLHSEEGATIDIFNSAFNGVNKFVSDAYKEEARLSVSSTVVPTCSTSKRFALWTQNLTPGYVFSNITALESRSGWVATASHNNGNAKNAIDSQASSRWDTAGSQANGQWFNVNFKKTITLNTIILESSASPGDGPAGYKAEVYSNGAWKQVAEGENGGAVTVMTFDPIEGSQVKITQTGKKGNYWSIHEFYVGNLDVSGIEDVVAADNSDIKFYGKTLYLPEDMAGSVVTVYTTDGKEVYSGTAYENSVSLDQISSGLYVLTVRNKDRVSTLKVKI